MNARTLSLLVAAALLALAVAFGIQKMREPRNDAFDNRPLLPQLSGHVNDVTSVTLTGPESKVIATLKRGDKGWGIAERGGYPADVGKIRELLLKIENARLIERKTENPKRYSEIGVDDVASKEAKGVRVDIAGLAQPTALIIGINNGHNGVGTFVRREGENQSWLVSSSITVPKNTIDWEKRDLMDVADTRWKSITLTGPEGTKVRLYKEKAGDNQFKLADAPKGRNPSVMTISTLATNFAAFRIDDAFPAKDMPPPPNASKAEYVAFDGLVIDAVAWENDAKHLAQLSARYDVSVVEPTAENKTADNAGDNKPAAKTDNADSSKPDNTKADNKTDSNKADTAKDPAEKPQSVQKEAEQINAALNGWTFVMQPNRFSSLRLKMDDLLEPPQPKTPPGKDLAQTPNIDPRALLPNAGQPPGAAMPK